MRTPKAFTSLQPRVARVSALPWVTGQRFFPTLKGLRKRQKPQLISTTRSCFKKFDGNNEAIYTTLSGLRHHARLLTQGSALTRTTLGWRVSTPSAYTSASLKTLEFSSMSLPFKRFLI